MPCKDEYAISLGFGLARPEAVVGIREKVMLRSVGLLGVLNQFVWFMCELIMPMGLGKFCGNLLHDNRQTGHL